MMRETVGGDKEDAVAPSSDKRGRGSRSGGNSKKFGTKRSWAIAKSRRGKSSSDSENGSKPNSGGRILEAEGQG